MNADDDYALRKAQRQMGPHGHWFMVGLILACLAVIRCIGENAPPALK